MNTPAIAAQKSLRYLLDSLNPKEVLYVEARANGSVPVAAARIAGYADPDEEAIRLEKNQMVRQALEYSLRVMAHAQIMTRRDVINGIHDAIQVAATAGEKIAGWKAISKIEGLEAPTKVEVRGEIRHTKEAVAKLSDEELAELAAIDVEFVRLEGEDGTKKDSA